MTELTKAQRSAMAFVPVTWDEPKPPIYQRPGPPCSALNSNACRNGFPVTRGCTGYRDVPICMHEEMCGSLYPDTGKPNATGETQP